MEWLLAVVLVEAEDSRENGPLAFVDTERLDCSESLEIEGCRPMRSDIEIFRFRRSDMELLGLRGT